MVAELRGAIDMETAHRHAALRLRELAATRATQAVELKPNDPLRAADCDRQSRELVAVAIANEDAAAEWQARKAEEVFPK